MSSSTCVIVEMAPYEETKVKILPLMFYLSLIFFILFSCISLPLFRSRSLSPSFCFLLSVFDVAHVEFSRPFLLSPLLLCPGRTGVGHNLSLSLSLAHTLTQKPLHTHRHTDTHTHTHTAVRPLLATIWPWSQESPLLLFLSLLSFPLQLYCFFFHIYSEE